MEVVTLFVGGFPRRYWIHRPAGSGPYPLVVFLHGAGGTATWADHETGWSTLASREGFLLAVPEGLPTQPSKSPKFLTNPQRWNDGSSQPGDALYSEADDIAFLTAVIADAVRYGPADPKRIYLSGFSNGAGMAFRLAAEQAELLAAIAPVAGHCWIRPQPVQPMPTLFLIGTEDPLVPLAGGEVRLPWGGQRVIRPSVAETLSRWAAGIGCQLQPVVEFNEGGLRIDRYPGTVEFRAMFVDGLGHHWPGGRGQLDPRIGGQPWNRISAGATIWDFFKSKSGGSTG